MFEGCSISSIVIGKGVDDFSPLYKTLMEQGFCPFYKIHVDDLQQKVNIPVPEGMPPPEHIVFYIKYPQNAFLS